MVEVRDPKVNPSLYERDFVLWAEQQAEVLRAKAARHQAGDGQALDFENLIEEIDGLARSQRWELRNRLATIIEHLLKLEYSPAIDPRPGWYATITRTRNEIEGILEDSPSLRREVSNMLARVMPRAVNPVVIELRARGELDVASSADLASRSYTEAEILGDWFPDPGAEATT